MQVQAVNIAHTRFITTHAGTTSTGIGKTPFAGAVWVEALGLAGDFIANKTLHGGLDQAVYLYSAEDNAWWATKLGRDIEPGTFGENLTLSEFDSRSCRIGDRLRIGELLLEISAPRTPCATLAARMGDPGFVKTFFAAARPGAYARVLQPGLITTGAVVEWLPTQEPFATTLDVFNQWNKKNKSTAVLKQALASPLASVHRGKVQQWLQALEG